MRNEPGPALRCEENDCRCGVEVERARLRVFAEMPVVEPVRGAAGRLFATVTTSTRTRTNHYI